MEESKLIEFYKEKSIQSFLMCIEIFNKPTIDYRLEGSVFFICNAWELLLKAKLLKDGKSIYYPNKEKQNRTLSLSDAAAKIMTNSKDPIRVNLDTIISLRNAATHSIIPEYEIIYTPFLSFCVQSYVEKLHDYFDVNISDIISSDFLSLFVSKRTADPQKIISKYGEGIYDLFKDKNEELGKLLESTDGSIATVVQINMARVNNRSEADFLFYATKNPKDQNIKYIDRTIDPNVRYPMSCHEIIEEVNRIIAENGIPFVPYREPTPTDRNPKPKLFSTASFDVLCKLFDFKKDAKYCQPINGKNGKIVMYKYSGQLITRIISIITADPEVVIKNKNS